MKIHGENLSAQTSGVAQQGQFNIKATGKAFKILSDGLYSDKPLAVVRELSCNAWDSHIAAGKVDVPFEVCLPTTLSPLFYVKDYGIGLSHEDVMVLFTTFFDSTKTESNDFVGALGLGSKSPFSYVDQFNVTSRFDGMVRKYTAFIGDGGFPSIALLSEDSTDECNGLEVGMPIKSGDVNLFVLAAQKVLPHFDTKPVVKGCSTLALDQKTLLRGSGWVMVDNPNNPNRYSRTESLKARMGAVCYPISLTGITDPFLSDMVYYPFIIDFPLGSLDVAASRESLSYDSRTVAAIHERLRDVKKEVLEVLEKDLDSAPSLWEAHILFDKTVESSGLRSILPKDHVIQWTERNHKGSALRGRAAVTHPVSTRGIKLKLDVLDGTDVRSTYRMPFNPRHLAEARSIKPRESIRIYCVDEKTGWSGKITHYEATHQFPSVRCKPYGSPHNPQILVVTGNYEKVIEQLGNPVFTLTSTLIADPSLVSQTVNDGGTRVKVKLSKVWEAPPGSSHFTEPKVTPDLSVHALVSAMWRGSPTTDGTQTGVVPRHLFAQITMLAKDAGLIPAENIMGIPTSHRELVKKTAWVDVFTFIDEALEKEVLKQRKRLWRWRFTQSGILNSSLLFTIFPAIMERGVNLTEINRLNAMHMAISTLDQPERMRLSALVRLCGVLNKEDLLGPKWNTNGDYEFPVMARKLSRLVEMFPLLKWAGSKERNPDMVEYVCAMHASHQTHASEVLEDNLDFGHSLLDSKADLPL